MELRLYSSGESQDEKLYWCVQLRHLVSTTKIKGRIEPVAALWLSAVNLYACM